VDFSRCLICLTSNLGAKEMESLVSGSIGFSPAGARPEDMANTDDKIYHTALAAARRKFSPEFMNRIDKAVVFRPLREAELVQILDLELKQVHERLLRRFARPLSLKYTAAAKHLLLEEGRDYRYGARHLKRAIERYVVFPVANLIATGQVTGGDELLVDADAVNHRLNFTKIKAAPPPAPRVPVESRRGQFTPFMPQPALAP
jgi:ATP-dependent Clp protease ATP-binding subunit ClpA